MSAPVVYLHGLGSTKMVWKKFDGLAINLPGHGGEPYREGMTLESIADDLAALIEKRGLREPVIVGHSLGGAIGLLVCERLKKVTAFHNIEGNLRGEDCGLLSQDTMEAGREAVVDGPHIEGVKKFFSRWPHKGGQVFAETLLENVERLAYYYYGCQLVEISYHGKLFERFAALPTRRVFIHGSESKISYVPELAERGVEIVRIDDADHWPHVTHPAEVRHA